MSVADRVIESKAYIEGEVIYPGNLCGRLGLGRRVVDQACVQLCERGALVRNPGGGYKRPQRHWINSAPLNDYKRLRAARLGA